MRRAVLVGVCVFLAVANVSAAQISGNYIEARTASVYVGACFANSEMGLIGKEALLGWQVTNGSWNGVPLSGLAVVGVVRAQDTLGDSKAFPVKSLLIVDQRATPEQAKALAAFARYQAMELFANVVHVEKAPIEFAVGGHEGHHGQASRLIVGDFARVVTRGLQHSDQLCANDELQYPPLATVTGAEPAFTITNEFKGHGLGVSWSSPSRASAFVGTFSR